MMLTKKAQRLRRSRQTRIRIAKQGVARLTVNRTNLHIYATVISDDGAKVIATASTAEAEVRGSLGGSGKGGNAAAAPRSASASPKRRRLPASRRSHSIAPVSPITAASRRWPMRRAKPACSSNRTRDSTWQRFRQNPERRTRRRPAREDDRDQPRHQGGEGRRILGFAALTVVGDGDGRVGMGKGKSKEVPAGRAEGDGRSAPQHDKVSIKNGTLHHRVTGHHGAASVVMMPAPKGTGIIAGGPMRAVFEVMGITDIVAKSHGSTNPYNMVRATLDALKNSTTASEVAAKRGKTVEEIFA